MKAEQKLAALTTLARNFGGEAWEFTRASIHSNGYITGRGGRTIVQTSGGDVPANVCRYIQQADPETMLVIAEAFDQIKKRAEAAEAIVADVEEVIGLLAEREWAEHCTKTDIGKRLEEAITELHNEAAPDVVDNQKAVGKFVFEPMGERWHHIKHGEAQHAEPKLPMVKLFTRPAPAINLVELVPSKLEEKQGDYQSLRDEKRGYNACIDKILRNIEESKQ